MINIHVYPSTFTHESRILREAGSIREFGCFERIDLVGVGGPGLPEVETVAPGLSICRLTDRAGNSAGFARKVQSALSWGMLVYRRYRHEPLGCINCHSVAVLPVCAMLKRASGAKLVYDAHELETETNGLEGIRKYLVKLVERLLIKHADHAIFVSTSIQQWYLRHYKLTRSAVIYNCPSERPIEANDYFRECFAIPAATPIFLYQGILARGRGIEALVEAFADLRDAVLVLMGYGPMTDWLEAQVKHSPGVYFHQAVAPDQLPSYTASADYGISLIEPTSLSYEYCMPNKLFEYLMAGKPVLVSPTTEQREFVRRLDVGVVAASTSAESVRNAVRELLARNRSELVESIVKAKAEFAWECQEERLREVYEALGFLGHGTIDA